MAEPRWLALARGYIGTKEIRGSKHNPLILRWWIAIRASWFKDDETPWCAAYVGGVLEEAGIVSSRSAAARSYLKWGQKLTKPAVGAVVVFSRSGGGHVGFVVGRDTRGRLMVLGGNQGDAVNIKPFSEDRILGYRWPPGAAKPTTYKLPVLEANGAPSTNEVRYGGSYWPVAGNPSPGAHPDDRGPMQPDDPGVAHDDTWRDTPSSARSRPDGWSRFKNWVLGGGIGTLGLGGFSLAGVEPTTIAVVVGAALIVFLIIWFTRSPSCSER